jgi:hypothetical protein
VKAQILILLFLLLAGQAATGYGAQAGQKYLLPDGLVLKALDGKLVLRDSNEDPGRTVSGWSFELAADASDGVGVVRAGERLQVLPSAALEKMTADAKEDPRADYRLRARITKYKGENFIFPVEYTPIAPVTEPQPGGAADANSKERGEAGPAINEPNDVVAIPQEVMNRLRSLKNTLPAARTEASADACGLRPDYLIGERTGLFADSQEKSTQRGRKAGFVLDALGRNWPETRFVLLPCEALERAEAEQSATLERPRFKIAGIVTKYHGRDYLLLHKASRVYSYANFPK